MSNRKSKPRHLSGKTQKARKLSEFQKNIASADEVEAPASVSSESAKAIDEAAKQPIDNKTNETSTQAWRPVAVPVPTPRTVARPKAAVIQQNYDYVTSDLRRIGLTSAAMFVILAVLAVVIR